jgi:nucleotide-binding universal stress UspA family protein
MGDADSDVTVLLCWEGSDSAERAIRAAGDMLGQTHRAVVLFVHVPTESARGVLGGLSGPDAPIMGSADAEVVLERGVRVARDAGFEATGWLIAADRRTAAIITATAEECAARLIVMGQKERSALGKLLLGSVSRDVLETHQVPVMLIGPGPPGSYPK